MTNLIQIPEWLGAAVFSAIIAALGYVAKLVLESWQRLRETRNVRRARLVELNSLLRATRVIFAVQNDHAKGLFAMIRERRPELAGVDQGYERTFANAFPSFTPDEKELHAIIRGQTIHSLRPTNEAILAWLRGDTHFKARKPSQGLLGELAQKLAGLEAHLILWHAKYETWIPGAPEHALVYLADEERHGVGFPSGIDGLVAKALE